MENAAQSTYPATGSSTSNDCHRLPVTQKQIRFARRIALGAGIPLPWEAQQDRSTLSSWIDQHHELLERALLRECDANDRPTSKQVAFAERLAQRRRRDVPDGCFRSRSLMSKWIDGNK